MDLILPYAAPRILRKGWIPDLPDHRDFLYSALQVAPTAAPPFPPVVDLRDHFQPVYDQGQLGSCTANAIAALVDYVRVLEQMPPVTPSRLFIYYNERAMEGTVGSDSGAQIRDGIKSVHKLGVCPEVPDWPYDITQFTVQPPAQAYTDALTDLATSYHRIGQSVAQMQTALASRHPFVAGISVYDSFEASTDGVIPMPGPDESLLGGHAIVITGYDANAQTFDFRNSWGETWGNHGYGTLPFAYLADRQLASDFWTILAQS